MIHIPPALVQGTNTPHGINVLSDYIEEQTGFPFTLDQSGWDDTFGYDHNNGYGYGHSIYNGNGFGSIN